MGPNRYVLIPDPDIINTKAIVTVIVPQYRCRNCGNSEDAIPLILEPTANGELRAVDWDLPRGWSFVFVCIGGQGLSEFPQKGGSPLCTACAKEMADTYQRNLRSRIDAEGGRQGPKSGPYR
jgi:hypothetical protein